MDNYLFTAYMIFMPYTFIGVCAAWIYGWQYAVIPLLAAIVLSIISIMRGNND